MARVSRTTLFGCLGLLAAMLLASWLGYVRGALQVPVAGSLILAICLLVLSAIDLETGRLPNWLTLPLNGLGLVQNWSSGERLWPFLIGGVAGYLLIFALSTYWLHRRGQQGMGLGDAKLLAASGTWLGVYALPGVLLIASAVGLIAIGAWSFARRQPIRAQMAIPFGPFLALGTWAVWCNTNL